MFMHKKEENSQYNKEDEILKCNKEISLQSFIPYSFITLSRFDNVGALTKPRSQNGISLKFAKHLEVF